MEKKKPEPLIASDDYQKFAKKKKVSLFDTALNAEGYQSFEYNKNNIPEAVRVSTKTYDKSGNDRKSIKKDGELTTEEMIEKVKSEMDIPKKKALTKVNDIKNPQNNKEREKDPEASYLAVVPSSPPSEPTAVIPSDESTKVVANDSKQVREYKTNVEDAVETGFFSGDQATLAEQELATAAKINAIIS